MPLLTCASVAAVVAPVVTSCGPSMYTIEWYKDKKPEITPFESQKETYTEEEATVIMFNGLESDNTLLANEIIADLYDFTPSTGYTLNTAHVSTISNSKKRIMTFISNSTYTATSATDIYYNTEARNIEYQVVSYNGDTLFAPTILVEVKRAYEETDPTAKRELTIKALNHAQELSKDSNWCFTYKTNNTLWGGDNAFTINASNIYEYALLIYKPTILTSLTLADYAIQPDYLSDIKIG